jgi:hypothetical protein
MARKRPSSHKREREYQKRQRELRKAEKAAQKRERRLNRAEPDTTPFIGDGEDPASADGSSPT